MNERNMNWESISIKWCTIKWKSFECKLGHTKSIYFPRYYEVVHYGNLLDDTENRKDENELKKICLCNSYHTPTGKKNAMFSLSYLFLSFFFYVESFRISKGKLPLIFCSPHNLRSMCTTPFQWGTQPLFHFLIARV